MFKIAYLPINCGILLYVGNCPTKAFASTVPHPMAMAKMHMATMRRKTTRPSIVDELVSESALRFFSFEIGKL
jgi:hypothetical protein